MSWPKRLQPTPLSPRSTAPSSRLVRQPGRVPPPPLVRSVNFARLWLLRHHRGMSNDQGIWVPVVASSEVGKKPFGCTRFGQNLVFWRSGGRVVCMPDRCPHRGAALSLGRIKNGAIACPFHGMEFSAAGKCVRVPVEDDPRIPEDFGVPPLPVREDNGYVWLWRGAEGAEDSTVELPRHSYVEGLSYGEAFRIWPNHFTRCIENVCDFTHLPFVHRLTIGSSKKAWVPCIEIEDVPGGFRAHLVDKGKYSQSFEFLYPNMWSLKISDNIMTSLVFAPIDETHTAGYFRGYQRLSPLLPKWLVDFYAKLTHYIVSNEDWPVVGSQQPPDVLEAFDERLFPSDSPVIAYRKLHRARHHSWV